MTPKLAVNPTCAILAGDIMHTPVVSTVPDATVQEAAKLLLDHGISAVPVLDAAGLPVGVVSEGDLIASSACGAPGRCGWWLALLAGSHVETEMLSPAALGRHVAEVMRSPAVTVPAEMPVAAIADVLLRHHIKQVPVMRGGRIVGVVGRADLLRAFTTAEPPAAPAPQPPHSLLTDLLSDFVGAGRLSTAGDDLLADDGGLAHAAPLRRTAATPVTGQAFRDLVAAAQRAKADAREAAAQQEELERIRRTRHLMQQRLDTDMWTTLLAHARLAAERGATQFELLRFPAELCTDHGRKIDVGEAGWPATLQGEAAEMYARWDRELKPAGFGLAVRVLDYPHGRLGDIGLALTWGEPT